MIIMAAHCYRVVLTGMNLMNHAGNVVYLCPCRNFVSMLWNVEKMKTFFHLLKGKFLFTCISTHSDL